MSDHTYPMSPVDEAITADAMAQPNADLTAAYNAAVTAAKAQTPPGTPPALPVLWTVDTYWKARNKDMIASWGREGGPRLLGKALANWPNLTQAARDLVCTDLGYPELVGMKAAVSLKYLSGLGLPAFNPLPVTTQAEVLQNLGLA